MTNPNFNITPGGGGGRSEQSKIQKSTTMELAGEYECVGGATKEKKEKMKLT